MRSQAETDPELLLDLPSGIPGLILDEIQYAPELFSRIKMRIDAARSKKGYWILTGSQQFQMMKGLSETLAGRIGLVELPTLCVREAFGDTATSKALFSAACLRGLYPELVADAQRNSGNWYAAYLQTYLERDIRTLYDIGNLREFERFLQLLAARCAQQLHLSHLASDVGVAVNTIRRWVSILEACGIIFLLQPWHANLGKRVVKTPKVYFMDCGLVCYLVRLRDAQHLLHGPMAGALFENLCIQEAVKRFLNLGERPRIYYYRDKDGLEVDLLVEETLGDVRPFELKLTQTPNQGHAESLVRFMARQRIPEASLVTLTEHPKPLTRTVQVLPLRSFL